MSGPASISKGLASIVFPCFNQLSYTRQCVAALARFTRSPWELVAIDDGSTDGTGAYLAGIQDVASFPVTVVTNTENRGFPAACNQGLKAARGEYLVLLNNDAVVTDGWLNQLVALADSDPTIGMTGPMSNYAPPPQLVPEASYADLEEMHQFAARWRREHRGKWLKAGKLSGFCLLIKRRVLDQVGALDEQFGLGLFDDDDLALRVRKAGFELALALDLFVHHFGSRTFAGAGIDAEALLATNRARFEAKWGPEAPPAREVTLTPRPGPLAASRSRRGDSGGRTWTKLFGVGLPRTGTTSVAAAMMELGLETCHACFDDSLFEQGDAFFDTPVYADFRRLDLRFPGSKFLLTWREPHAWYVSFARSLGGYLQRLRTDRRLSAKACVDRRCYALAFGEAALAEEPFIARYLEHRRHVEEHFRDRPGDLLIFDVTDQADPWDALCRFLDRPRPVVAFPHHNSRNVDYWKQLKHPNKLGLEDDPSVAERPQRPLAANAIQGGRCQVSLTMIVRNEAANLPDCLASAADLFDEIVIVDTGSTDRTVEIARSFRARVFDFVWVDDFAAARNAALARATGDYAFWLDADDRVEPTQRERLRALFDGLRSTNTAYVVRCACDPDSGGGGATVVDHIRLFPVREDVRWTYRVHEQILPSLRRAGVAVQWTDVVVRHVGYNDPALRKTKLARDRAILESELSDRPDDPFVLFNVGQVALEGGEPGEALGYLRRSLAGSSPGDSITRKLHALIARAHQQLGDPEAALAACAAGLSDLPDDAELLFRKGVLHRLRGEPEAAGSCWQRILTLRRPDQFASVDVGIYGHVTRRNLANLAEERGERAEARVHWSAVLAERPGDAEAARALRRLSQTHAPAGEPSS